MVVLRYSNDKKQVWPNLLGTRPFRRAAVITVSFLVIRLRGSRTPHVATSHNLATPRSCDVTSQLHECKRTQIIHAPLSSVTVTQYCGWLAYSHKGRAPKRAGFFLRACSLMLPRILTTFFSRQRTHYAKYPLNPLNSTPHPPLPNLALPPL